jgi:hypothetical protein
MMLKWISLGVMAGVAGLTLAAGDASAAVRRTTVTRTTTHTVTRASNTQQRFHNAGVRQHTNRIAHTQQRFHSVNTRRTTTTVTRLSNTQQRFHKASIATTHFTHSDPSLRFKPGNKATGLTHFNPGNHAPGLKIGPAKVTVAKKTTFPIIKIANKSFPIWKNGPKRIWVGGHWKTFVGFSAIPVVLIGRSYFWPDAYVNVGRPYCTGETPDGCHLNWQAVNFEDGGRAFQCVQFCPRPGAQPPAQVAALVPPPPAPANGTCELTIYSEANFTGQDATTGDEQPQLSQTGWQDQIVSVQVKSGVWDFFSEENYGGNNMRLRPGAYQDLGPEWDKKINSFNCVMNAAPGATAAQ